MDLNSILILAAVWFLFNLLAKTRRKPMPRRPEARTPLPSRPVLTTLDATQREGNRLELVLREFQRALEQAGSANRLPQVALPREEEVEEFASLEVEPEVANLETQVSRPDRQLVDQDEEAEAIATRRIREAAARDVARSKLDHVEFDRRIRQEPADHTATRRYTPQQLRDAVVWREILGPPASLK